MSTRKPRSDSTTAALFAIENARKPAPEPPIHAPLRDCDKPFWAAIVAGRGRDEWRNVDLVLAAQLARCQADIEREAAILDTEGTVLDGRANPRAAVVEAMVKRELALMRSLRMGGSATGKAETIQNARSLETKYSDLNTGSLIAR